MLRFAPSPRGALRTKAATAPPPSVAAVQKLAPGRSHARSAPASWTSWTAVTESAESPLWLGTAQRFQQTNQSFNAPQNPILRYGRLKLCATGREPKYSKIGA